MRDRSRSTRRTWTTALLLTGTLLGGTGCGGSSSQPPPELPQQLQLVAEADAFVCSDDWAGQNHGTESYSPRAVGQQNDFTGNQVGRQVYRFAAPGAWSGAVVASATLRLMVYDNYAGFPLDMSILGYPDGWSETGITWQNAPLASAGALDTVTVGCCGKAWEFDVTDYVNAQLAAGDTNFSFELRSDDEASIGGVRWWQREGDGVTINMITGEAPALTLER